MKLTMLMATTPWSTPPSSVITNKNDLITIEIHHIHHVLFWKIYPYHSNNITKNFLTIQIIHQPLLPLFPHPLLFGPQPLWFWLLGAWFRAPERRFIAFICWGGWTGWFQFWGCCWLPQPEFWGCWFPHPEFWGCWFPQLEFWILGWFPQFELWIFC